MWNQRCILFLREGGAVDPKTTSGIDNVCIYIYIYMYTWILLIVEISTPKPKSITFAKFRKKELMNGYFHSRTLFSHSRTLPNSFGTFFWRFLNAFFHSERPKCPERQKSLWCSFFPHQPPKSTFFGFGVKNSCVGRLQASYFLEG